MDLTEKQHEALQAIATIWQIRGYSPSMGEIAEAIHVSRSAASVLVDAIEKRGYISREANKSRTIRILKYPTPLGGPVDHPPEPGIYENVPFEDYLAWDAVSNSRITLALRSLAHYRAGYTQEATPPMRIGSLVHCGALEPLAIAQRYAVMPAYEMDPLNQTKDGKPTQSKATTYYRDKAAQFAEANRNKEIVTQDEYDNLVGLVRSLVGNEHAMECLGGSGPVEVSLVWTDAETGLLCKARVDKWQQDKRRFCDLKTCRDPLRFNQAIATYGYHRQMAFYQMGLRALLAEDLHQTPYLVAIEQVEPWGCRAARMHEEWLVIGREEVKRALRSIADAKNRDEWPGYASPEYWLPPGWYGEKADPVELIINGETVLA